MLFRLLLHVLVELNPPGFNDRDLRETESVFLLLGSPTERFKDCAYRSRSCAYLNECSSLHRGVRCYGGLVLVDLLAATWQDWSC